MKKIKRQTLLFLRWLAMWTCDVIPGVSGWTIAFITWVYDELLDALSSFNLVTFKLFVTGKRRSFWKAIHGNFLLLLFGGVFIAILSLAKIISFLLQTYPSLVWAFFFGLILASALILRKSIKKRHHKYVIFAIIGVAIWFLLTTLKTVNIWVWSGPVFFSWFFAIIAMILPGISGSYILLILWQYQNILQIVIDVADGVKNFISNGFNFELLWGVPIGQLLLFLVWAIAGLLLFSKFLHYIKNRRHDYMIVVLTGFMVWSLNKVRPRKQTVETFIDRHGDIQPLVQKNILPQTREQLLPALWLFLLWLWVVFGIMQIAKKRR